MASVLEEILSWSASRAAWQQDALRRLLDGNQVGKDVIDSYADAAMGDAGIDLYPLAAEHIAGGGSPEGQVNVMALRDAEHVNRLTGEQELKFADVGLTVVYGDNGSGKSGYARILKSVSRARAAAVVRNDIFDEDSHIPTAVIAYSVAGVSQPLFEWSSGGAYPSELATVSFFDRSCSQVYLTKDTDAAFRPFGLDLFDSLSAVCGEVKEVLDHRLAEIGRKTPGMPELDASTQAGQVISQLKSTTSDAEIDDLAVFTVEGQARLEELSGALVAIRSGNAVTEADRLKRLADRVERAAANLADGVAAVSVQSYERLIALRDDAATKATAASAAREGALENAELAGVGEAVWRVLWEAARGYSIVAYPGRDFPVVDDALCLLCQQPIEDDAGGRLRQFEAFVTDTTQAAAAAAELSLRAAVSALQGLEIGGKMIADLVDDLRPEVPRAADGVEVFVSAAQATRSSFLAATSDSSAGVEAFPVSPVPLIEEAVVSLRAREAALRTAVSAGGTDDMAAELAELEARKKLYETREAVVAERDRLRRVAAIERAKSGTATNAISQKASDLTTRVLTDVLVNRFARESERLGLDHVQLTTVGGRRGVLKYKADFLGARQDAPLPEVLSEGEQSALGMAGFLTELWTDESKSAAVFDDPVSSLDHGRRDKVAERLVLLAQERPTIVFTHDVAFIIALKKHAVREGVAITERSIERINGRPGRCLDHNRFSSKLVKERVEELSAEIVRLEQIRSSTGDEEYWDMVGSWYKRLRQTWERAIEESLLGEILTRHDLHVHPLRVRSLVLFTAEDNRELHTAMAVPPKAESPTTKAR